MLLKIRLPHQVFLDQANVTRIVIETKQGAYGLLPQRLDCVAILTPGILTFSTLEGNEVFIAVDEGVLVKTGLDVLVSVRNAILGNDLIELRTAVQHDFLALDEEQQKVRVVMAKLESGFLHRFAAFKQP